MRSILLGIISLISIFGVAQAPQSFKYQAVVRDGSGNVLSNTAVGMQITIRQTSASGIVVYEETFSSTTSPYGLVNINVGQGTSAYDFTTIDWGNGEYFIETAVDVNGGTNYIVMGTSQILSVPYALHAGTVDDKDDADADPTNEIQDLSISGNDLTISGGNTVTLPGSANNGGKTHLIIAGNISQADLATKLASDLGPNTQFVSILNTTQITSIDLSSITELVSLQINNTTNLTSVNLSGLQTIYEYVTVQDNADLSTLDLSTLGWMNGLFTAGNNASLSGLNLSQLNYADGIVLGSSPNFASINLNGLDSLNFGSLEMQNLPSLTTADFSSLIKVKNTQILISNTGLSSLDFPNLTIVSQSLSISGNSNLSQLTFGSPITTGGQNNYSFGITIGNNPLLTSLDLSTMTIDSPQFDENYSINGLTSLILPQLSSTPTEFYSYATGNKLPSSNINSLLSDYVTRYNNGVMPMQIMISGQTPSAPPSGQGITDKATLTNAGFNVTTD